MCQEWQISIILLDSKCLSLKGMGYWDKDEATDAQATQGACLQV